MQNNYFQVLSLTIQQALGKAAFDAYIHAEPHFQFTGKWEDLKPEMRSRWQVVVEAVMNQIQDMDEFVTTELMAYNERQRVLADATDRFENWKQDEGYHNNYQQLAQLISLHAEVVNAQLLVNRKDIEQGKFQVTGVEDTQRVRIPNISKE